MKACIFDLDGTLTDTLESLVYSVQATLKEMGMPQITREQCRTFVGNGAKRLMEKSLVAAGDEKLSRLDEGMQVYGRIFDANCTYHVTPYNGITEMLQTLKQKGIRLAVLSNKPHAQTVKVVKEIFGDGIFDYVSGQQEGMKRKPAPDGVWHIMEVLETEASQCLYVGDSEVDIETGKNAGLKTISVTWGFRSEEELKEAKAEIMIDSPAELFTYV